MQGWGQDRRGTSHNSELEFEIAKILDSKVDQRHCNCKLLYLICWTGYAGTDEETSWILAMELGNAPELVVDYHTLPDQAGPPPSHLTPQIEKLENYYYYLDYSSYSSSDTSRIALIPPHSLLSNALD